ncbi:MAG: DUF7678 domain-containing protein [Anaerovoracaceae bacterium]
MHRLKKIPRIKTRSFSSWLPAKYNLLYMPIRANIHIPKEKRTEQGGKTMWNKGSIEIENTICDYWVKHYEEPNEDYGIDGGRISKLMRRRRKSPLFGRRERQTAQNVSQTKQEALRKMPLTPPELRVLQQNRLPLRQIRQRRMLLMPGMQQIR